MALALVLHASGPAAFAQVRHHVPLFMSASNADRQGFVRVVNYDDRAGTVTVHAVDDTGYRPNPVSFSLGAKETVHFNSDDLEGGNPSKGMHRGVGPGNGDWRLQIETALDIEPLAYVRTSDGFLTSMHEVTAAEPGAAERYRVPTFNPGSNRKQQSRLRLVNPGRTAVEVEIDGLDDDGDPPPLGPVHLTLPAGAARVLTAQQIEDGDRGLSGRFGDGSGKWQLFVSADQPIQVMSLLRSPTRHLTNLTRGRLPGERSIPLFMAASAAGQQGFVRIINRSERDGTVRIHAYDDRGDRFGPVSFSLGAKETAHFNSGDLERGNTSKGLRGDLGDGIGNWRLEPETTLDIEALAYVRTSDGFLTSVHEVAGARGMSTSYWVPTFNPASNTRQQSMLRLVNPGSRSAEIEIDGLDDNGAPPRFGSVRLTLAAGSARVISAAQLEDGDRSLSGRFGDGSGKWQLFVSARAPIQVMSLLRSPTGHLTNLSGSSVVEVDPTGAPVAHDVSLSSNLTTPYIEAQLIGTDPDGDTLLYVLDGQSSGPGYLNAFVQPGSGRLFAELDPGDLDRVEIPYKVTNGTQFSEPAKVIVAIEETPTGGRGNLDQDPEEYGLIELDYFDLSSLPPFVDLSGNFPSAGNQGRQGSCVGWATAYALKTYQERVEEGWEFSPHTRFSPAWVYNQIRIPGPCDNPDDRFDCGSYIHEALELFIRDGAATESTMPYNPSDYLAQPSFEARREAARYKARGYRSLRSLEHLKGALANRLPVVIGMPVYRSFRTLSGRAPVYNDLGGQSEGGHAVTLVGYDDNRFGGAFKVINSWGQGWGDRGFFWLPYATVRDSRFGMHAYVLADGPNDDDDTRPRPPTPPPCGQGDPRPNLVPASWRATYNAEPGGAGRLRYVVRNTGRSTAPAGVDVNLILSDDLRADTSDYWVTYEEIPFVLRPGASAIRDDDNPLDFRFPETIPAGTYNMAVWVDDVGEVRECDESDNVSLGNNQVEFRFSLPDIAVESWWARWDRFGRGRLEYRVVNKGTSTIRRTDWDINLVLHTLLDPTDRRGSTYYLFYEDAGHRMAPGDAIFRDSTNPAFFNLLRDQQGVRVPSGLYYMSLWVDDLGQIRESNEWNNVSVGNNLVSILSASSETVSSRAAPGDSPDPAPPIEAASGSTFNGQVLPDRAWQKVEIIVQEDGARSVRFLEEVRAFELLGATVGGPSSEESEVVTYHESTNHSSDVLVFPRGELVRMP